MGQESQPLTDEERAELEQLRAERAARLAEEQAMRERAELEALRAERSEVEAGRAVSRPAPAAQGSPSAARPTVSAAERERIRRDAEARERGRRLMEPDDDLSMPLGQKIVLLAVALICVAVLLAMFVFPR